MKIILMLKFMEEKKHLFLFGEKFKKKEFHLNKLQTLLDLELILDNVDECYKTLGIFHKKWNCIPGKFKDYISSPKINGINQFILL